jgi:AIPR protein
VPTNLFTLIDEESSAHRVGSRTQSAALLAWFLSNVWRLELDEVDDAICDGSGDKGIDGLVVDDDQREITLFQVKHRESATKTQGDSDLQHLVGAAPYFDSVEAAEALIASGPNTELLKLLVRHNIRDRVADGAHVTRLVFVTNAPLDANGATYRDAVIAAGKVLEVWDRDRVGAVAERTRRPDLGHETVTLTAAAAPIEIGLTQEERMAIAVVSANQLVALPGIADSTLFSRNVRLHIGRTRINRELANTVQDASQHKLFPAYHNGLTLLTRKLTVSDADIQLDGVSVVNGCQSLVALYANRRFLTTDLKLLIKIIELTSDTGVADDITYRTNNQNAVDMRDQRSTDPIMRDLQGQVAETYGTTFGLAIREGEQIQASRVLDNQFAAQLIKAVYLEEPWAAVQQGAAIRS